MTRRLHASLLAGPALVLGLTLLPLPSRAGWEDDEPRYEEERVHHLRATGWGGGSVRLDQGGDTSGWAGAELGWLFSESSLSGLFEVHRFGAADATRTWTPVVLLRFEQRFETRRGLEGTLTLGLGAGKPDADWISWYQLAVGVRLKRDPLFVCAEVGFERDNFLRFGAGIGVSF